MSRAIYNFRFFATFILHLEQKSTEIDHVAINYTSRTPRGVVLFLWVIDSRGCFNFTLEFALVFADKENCVHHLSFIIDLPFRLDAPVSANLLNLPAGPLICCVPFLNKWDCLQVETY